MTLENLLGAGHFILMSGVLDGLIDGQHCAGSFGGGDDGVLLGDYWFPNTTIKVVAHGFFVNVYTVPFLALLMSGSQVVENLNSV